MAYQPIDKAEAEQVVAAVITASPLGEDSCDFCQHPVRNQLDVDLLITSSIAEVAVNYQFATRSLDPDLAKSFAAVCTRLEQHRRLHIIKVFEGLSKAQSELPDTTAPTIRFVEWAIGEYSAIVRDAEKDQDRIAALRGFVSALQTRATLRGEILEGKRRSPDTIEVESQMTPETQRKILELQARKLGMRLVAPKQAITSNTD